MRLADPNVVRALAVPGSLTIHVIVALAWMYAKPAADRPARRDTPRIELVPATEAVPVEIVMLDPLPTTPTATQRSTSGRSVRSTRRSGSTTTSTPTTTEPGSSSPGRLSMRQPRSPRAPRANLGLTAAAIDRIASEAIEPIEAPQISGLMRPSGGGTHVIPDRVTTVRVDADGAVDFEDKRNLQVRVGIPIPSRRKLGAMISDWYRDPYAQTRAGPVGELPPHEQAVPGGWDSGSGGGGGGSEEPSSGGGGIPILAGGFDLTDWAIRKAGGDPYSARKKKILDRTSDERMAIGVAHRARQLARSAELMQKHLERAWATIGDPAARKTALFELWDECDEGEGPSGEAGERARAQVLGWIGAHLPAGDPDAYTTDELARLNARRRSAQIFTPY